MLPDWRAIAASWISIDARHGFAFPALDLAVDFASRTLIAAPYDSQNWYSYAGQFPYKDDPQSYFAGEPYLINAIAY
ncbi:MAG: hypothetical protein AAF629_26900, partial [Chloroflexota bacterium]